MSIPTNTGGETSGQTALALFKDYDDPGEHEFLGLFYSQMDRPLTNWDKQCRGSGRIFRILDKDKIHSLQLIQNFTTTATYITAPRKPFSTLGIKLEWITLIIMSIRKSVMIIISVKDDLGLRRRFVFRNSILQPFTNTHLTAFIQLQFESSLEWNQLQFNLADLTHNNFGTTYKETVRIQISASCRLRMIYFSKNTMDAETAASHMKGVLSVISADVEGDPEWRRKSYLLVPSLRAAFVPTIAEHHRLKQLEPKLAAFKPTSETPLKADVRSSIRVVIHPGRSRPQTATSHQGTTEGKKLAGIGRPHTAYP